MRVKSEIKQKDFLDEYFRSDSTSEFGDLTPTRKADSSSSFGNDGEKEMFVWEGIKRSFPVGQTSRSRHSDAPSQQYVSICRRRYAQNVLAMIKGLEDFASEDCFSVRTIKVLELCKRAINELDNLERNQFERKEGNSNEIFRIIRDSLLRDGWEKYRSMEVRDAAITCIKFNCLEQAATARDAQVAMERIADAGACPVLTLDFIDVDEEGEEQEKAESDAD